MSRIFSDIRSKTKKKLQSLCGLYLNTATYGVLKKITVDYAQQVVDIH